MPSFKSEMEVDGETYSLLRTHFYGFRKRDPKGRPSSKAGWMVVMQMDLREESTISSWMLDKNSKKEVTIKFYNADDDSTLKEWQLTEAVCYNMSESFIADAGFMLTTILVAGTEIGNGNATLKYDLA
ncbi:MAG: hypothetical protein H7Y12_07245 [Sphingobacteriaceae bacterium]|nr:hypothetical protein [Cytophagaceae bacterium]